MTGKFSFLAYFRGLLIPKLSQNFGRTQRRKIPKKNPNIKGNKKANETFPEDKSAKFEIAVRSVRTGKADWGRNLRRKLQTFSIIKTNNELVMYCLGAHYNITVI